MEEDDLREMFHANNWSSLTTPLNDDQQALGDRLLAEVRAAHIIAPDAARIGDDDCIIIWPSHGKVATTSIFPRMHGAMDRSRMAHLMAESAERRTAEAEERYKALPTSVAPDYRN